MRVSVVIPVYNEAEQIGATIASVTAAIAETETLGDAEIVVADDGSSDDSGPVALRAATTVPVRVASLDANEGKFSARRTGLQAAEGTYVLLLDTGVSVVPGSLSYLEHELARDPDATVWNAHTVTNTGSSPFALFWGSSRTLPRRIQGRSETHELRSGGVRPVPKGHDVLLRAKALCSKRATHSQLYEDPRHASDDSASFARSPSSNGSTSRRASRVCTPRGER